MSYHFNQIQNYSRQLAKIYCDRTGTVGAGEEITYTLPQNTLTDLDSLLWQFFLTIPLYSSATYNAATEYRCRHFPRNSQSIIDTLSVYVNDQLVCTTKNYHQFANSYCDNTCGLDYSMSGIRQLENTDPSVKQVYDAVNDVMTVCNTADVNGANISDNKRPYCVRNWFGFLGSLSTRVINTALFGRISIKILLAEPAILWASKTHTTGATNIVVANATPSYEIDASTAYMTINKIMFNDSTYYNLLEKIVQDSGLVIPFKTYTTHRGSEIAKAAGSTAVTQFTINSSHLNKIYAMPLRSDYRTEGNILNTSYTAPYGLQVVDRSANIFNQSRYFAHDGTGISSVSWEINNVNMYPQPLSSVDVFNENINNLNLQSDVQAGIHGGAASILHWIRLYWVSVLSFDHVQNQDAFTVEGLDGLSAPINVKFTINFDSATAGIGRAGNIIPLFFIETTKMLRVDAGQQVSVIN